MTCNEVLISLINLCDKKASVCHGCNGPLKNNGLPFPPLYDLFSKTRREYLKDGKKQISAPSNIYFHVFHENPFIFQSECVQRRMMTMRMDSVKLHWDAFKSMSHIHKINLQFTIANITCLNVFLNLINQ